MIYPEKVQKDDMIGVTAMSAGLNDERGKNKEKYAKENFEKLGFSILETDDVMQGRKLVSASAKKRAEEFLNLWNNDNLKYILIACGGEFLMETLPYLHAKKAEISAKNPKWVQGFSDVSLLLFYLTTNYDIATVHSYGFSSYAMTPLSASHMVPLNVVLGDDETCFEQLANASFEAVRNREVGHEADQFNLSEKVEYRSLYNRESLRMSGRLIGGCMDVLKVLVGTPFDNVKNFCSKQEEGCLWYLENCEMSIADVKRTLWQMKMAGWFDNAKGFIFGRTLSSASMDDFTYEDALHDVFDDMHVDVVYDVDFGHTAPQWTLINGALATFEYENGSGKIVQKMC